MDNRWKDIIAEEPGLPTTQDESGELEVACRDLFNEIYEGVIAIQSSRLIETVSGIEIFWDE